MKAVVLEKHGAPEALTYTDIPEPAPAADEVKIRVDLAGASFAETMIRAGTYPAPFVLPAVLGFEVAGTVVERGRDVETLRVGEAVVALLKTKEGRPRGGGYAESVVVSAAHVRKRHTGIEPETALALLGPGLTAYAMIHEAVKLAPGVRVLVHGGAGAVGSMLVQLALAAGASRVWATEVSESKVEHARAVGAEAFVLDEAGDWVTKVRASSGGVGVDVVFDGLGGGRGLAKQTLSTLAAHGRVVTYGVVSGAYFTLDEDMAKELVFKNLNVMGFGGFAYLADEASRSRALGELEALVLRGAIRTLSTRFPLARVADAHHALAEHRAVGKVYLVP